MSAATARAGTAVGLVIGVVLVAANLRVTLTGVGSLLPEIERGSGLSPAWGGLLTTLPLLTFAATSPLVGRVSHRFAPARLLVITLITLAVGTIIRSLPSVVCLFAGTVVLSAAIAFGNVLLPAIIRRGVSPQRISTVSALYVTVMGLTAAISSGVSVPLARVLPGEWRGALAWGIVLVFVALAVWLPRTRGDRPMGESGVARSRMPLRSGLAWLVSFYMGLQSLAFYSVIAWLPSILAEHGASAAAAGWMLFYYQLVGIVASGVVPLLTRGRHDQRYIAAAVSLMNGAGFVLLLVWPGLSIVACTLLGLGGGACLVLALTFQSQRAGSAGGAAALAGMAQSVGYLVAAAGPVLLGVLRESTHRWTVPLAVLATLSLVMTMAGYGAGRDRHVVEPARDHVCVADSGRDI